MIKIINKFKQVSRLQKWFSDVTQRDNQKSNILKQQQKKYQIPVYLRPYDKTKYQVPSTKIKRNSGYAMMQIQPFPRARIMRLALNLFEKMKQIPENYTYRLYTQQKMKYIITLTDEIQDIQELEVALGCETIQLFIYQLSEEYQLFDYIKSSKPWLKEVLPSPQQLRMMRYPRKDVKNPRYIRPPRIQKKFIQQLIQSTK